MQKILIAEDEPLLRDAYVMILHHAGYEVVEAADGRQALDIAESEKPNLLILDMLMPRMTGIEVLRHPRMRQLRQHTKIIAFTNLSDAATVEELAALGVDCYLLKSSIMPNMLVSTVREVIAGEARQLSAAAASR